MMLHSNNKAEMWENWNKGIKREDKHRNVSREQELQMTNGKSLRQHYSQQITEKAVFHSTEIDKKAMVAQNQRISK